MSCKFVLCEEQEKCLWYQKRHIEKLKQTLNEKFNSEWSGKIDDDILNLSKKVDKAITDYYKKKTRLI